MTDLVHRHCWNHEIREAVCRCPACGRDFCRECVTEYESRLLCAACLKTAGPAVTLSRRRSRGFLTSLMAVGGAVLSWLVFYGAGQVLLEFATRFEEQKWRLP